MIHSLDVEIAKRVGVNAALVYDCIVWWCAYHKANNIHFYDGHHWMYNTLDAWVELFPYLSRKQIRYALAQLCREGLIIKRQHNNDKLDHTSWFAIADESILLKPNDVPLRANRNAPEGKSMCPVGQINIHTSTIHTSTIPKEKEKYKKEKERGAAEVDLESFLTGGWSETMQMTQGVDRDGLRKAVSDSIAYCVTQGIELSDGNIKHYALTSIKNRRTDYISSSMYETRDRNGRRWYTCGATDYEIPSNAPPRPSALHLWDYQAGVWFKK